MVALLLLAHAQMQAMEFGYNGVWVSPEGYAFTLANPFTIWATVGSVHASAYNVHRMGDGFYAGSYEFGDTMVRDLEHLHYETDEQTSAQVALEETDPGSTSELPKLTVKAPQAVPFVVPSHDATTFGRIQIRFGPLQPDGTVTQLNMKWETPAGSRTPLYSGPAYFVGKSDAINCTGSYVGQLLGLKLTDTGKGSKRDLQGEVRTKNGSLLTLRGKRVWGRGTFELTDSYGEHVGSGWLEWEPTPEYFKAIQQNLYQPSDRLLIWINLGADTEPGTTDTLSRVGANG